MLLISTFVCELSFRTSILQILNNGLDKFNAGSRSEGKRRCYREEMRLAEGRIESTRSVPVMILLNTSDTSVLEDEGEIAK